MAAFLQQGIQSSEQPLSQFIRLAVQNMVQQAVEQEVTDFLGRDRYERQAKPVGYRNGYKPGRIRSAEGEIALDIPQVRGTEETVSFAVAGVSAGQQRCAGISGHADVQSGTVDARCGRRLS